MKNKPTPFEVYIVAEMMWKQQSGHPSNWESLESFVPKVIKRFKKVAEVVDKEFE